MFANLERVARDVGGQRTCEEEHGGSSLVGGTRSTQRNLPDERGA